LQACPQPKILLFTLIVVSIGNDAFGNCSALTDVTIPDSVKTIGKNAFIGCANLTNVTIGSSVTSIGDSVFRGCTNLTSVTIPNSVTAIGIMAFGNNPIIRVTIGSNVLLINALPNSFDSFYNSNGGKAGTYIYENETWSEER